jgi:hypothetical protein
MEGADMETERSLIRGAHTELHIVLVLSASSVTDAPSPRG